MSGAQRQGGSMTAAPGSGFDGGGCTSGEAFALRVLGDDMAPEFRHGEIIVVEPEGALKDGSFVVAQHEGEWLFRQLRRAGDGWVLHALNAARAGRPDLPDLALADLGTVRGVVIQKAVPGRRRLSRFYV